MSVQNRILPTEMEPDIQASPVSSLPLRRKSMLIQKDTSNVLLYNDDEAERLAIRSVNKSILSSGTSAKSDRRRSLGLAFLENMPEPKMAEHMSQCLKLSAENKINVKNAFSLEMIDFMTYMVRKRDSNMSNLQIASTSLDASTKIYGFRVDGVHTDILKMIGALDNQSKNGEDGVNEMDCDAPENDQNEMIQTKKRQKTKSKQKILNTEEALSGNIETEYPSVMTAVKGDSQTTDMLYLASLPIHGNNLTEPFYLQLHNDVILDTIDIKVNDVNKSAKYITPIIRDFINSNICASLYNFEFLKWSIEEEVENIPSQEDIESDENRFQFDLDSSIPSGDKTHPTAMTYFDIDNDQGNVNFCVRETIQGDNIVDLRSVIMQPVIKSSKPSEYSFIHKHFKMCWAGPSYWKIKICNKPLSNSNLVEKCQQTAIKKKKEIELFYDEDIQLKTNEKFQQGQQLKLQTKTARNDWQEKKITLPEDTHYKTMELFNTYYHPLITLYSEYKDHLDFSPGSPLDNTSNAMDSEDIHVQDDNFESEEFRPCDEMQGIETQMPLTGDNLIDAPKLTNKIFIQYSQRAKKMDMRQLKKSLWKCLISSTTSERKSLQQMVQEETENKIQGTKQFSEVYKALPSMLSKTNTEALSFHIAFVSLLHLANEKSLKISSLADMSDLIIEGGS